MARATFSSLSLGGVARAAGSSGELLAPSSDCGLAVGILHTDTTLLVLCSENPAM